MNNTLKRIVSILISAVTVFSSFSGISAFADELSLQPQKVQYEVDSNEYKAKIDEFYSYIPLDKLVVASLNKIVNGYDTFFCPYDCKWFYKHVFLCEPELKISIHESDKDMPEGIPFTADSLGLMAEQGRADSIEEEDGIVRKFNDIDIYWNTLISERKQDEQAVNQFLSESGYNVSAVQDEKAAKKFYLQVDDKITSDEILMIDLELYKKFGFLPKTVTYEKGVYKLYRDLDYIGMTIMSEIKAGQWSNEKKVSRLRNNGSFENGVEYHLNPDNKVLIIDGKGVINENDAQKVFDSFIGYLPSKRAKIIIIGKDVILENNDKFKDTPYNWFISWLSDKAVMDETYKWYTYHNSSAEKEFNNLLEESWRWAKPIGVDDTKDMFEINFLSDDIDPKDVLEGKVIINTDIKNASEQQRTTTPSNAKDTLQGDANLDGMVDLADLTTVAKYNLSNSSYPLANDTAYANADMNSDGKVDGLDTSALIENQLGKK